MSLVITDDLDISYKNSPLTYFPLPKCKQIRDEKIIHLTGVVLSISRDAFDLAQAIERLEDRDIAHSRHLVVDRDGKLYQFAPLTQPIYHLPTTEHQYIDNYNSISVELINAGKLFNSANQNILLQRSSSIGKHRVEIPRDQMKMYYRGKKNINWVFESIHFDQYHSLNNLLRSLRRLSPNLRVVDCGRWQSLSQFALTPSFPRRNLGVEYRRS